jgi:hypothetical protein
VAGGWDPDLALDSNGHPHIAFMATDLFVTAWEVRYSSWDGAAWVTETLAFTDPLNPALALDLAGDPHILSTGDGIFEGGQVASRDGGVWAYHDLPYSNGGALAVDALGSPQIAYQGGNVISNTIYQDDLHYRSWAPAWQAEPVAASGFELSLAVDLYGQPVVSYWNGAAMRLAHWARQWLYPLDLPGARHNALGLTFDGLDSIAHLAYQRTATGNVEYAVWGGGPVVTQTIANAGGVGATAIDLAFDPFGSPIVGYWDASALAIKLAERAGAGWQVHTNDAAPALDGDSGTQSLALGHTPAGADLCCRSYIAYYGHTTEGGMLRVATWDGAAWTDALVDGGAGVGTGYYASLGVDYTSGEPAVAYYDVVNHAVKYAARSGATWQTEVVTTTPGSVYDLSLDLGAVSIEYPRIAFSTWPSNTVFLASKPSPTSTWQIEQVVGPGPAQLREVVLDTRDRDRILYAGSASDQVVYLFRTATLPFPLYYNPLQPCTEEPEFPSTAEAGHGPAAGGSAHGAAAAPGAVPDLDTLRGLRDLFATDPDGQAYIDLYYAHAAETGAIGLADPDLLWDAYLTLQNFLPGFASLVAGHGDEVVITQAMVDQANGIAGQLMAAGSPALDSAIAQEQAAFDGLQDFVGLTFSEASALLGVPAPVALDAVYLPLLQH